ncbi:positive regulator of sigma E activity [Elusimicrobium posterum]|uniref:hypothetical protein n=1 Tax=Elusimicrobium posterum TaxID=3116653 RepID=UPI003C745517
MKKSTLFYILALVMIVVSLARLVLYMVDPGAMNSSSPILGVIIGFIIAGCALFMASYTRKDGKDKSYFNANVPPASDNLKQTNFYKNMHEKDMERLNKDDK